MTRAKSVRQLSIGIKRIGENRKSKDPALAQALIDLAVAVELLCDETESIVRVANERAAAQETDV